MPTVDRVPGSQWADALGEILRDTQYVQLDGLIDDVNRILAPLRLQASCYLVDEEQEHLWPMPQSRVLDGSPIALQGTVAGRCFITLSAVLAARTLWLPLLDGTERLGVLAMSGPSLTDPEVQERCQQLSTLIAHLIAVGIRYADTAHQVRRTRKMSVGSELLQAMLPPLTFTTRSVSISAVLQPVYEMNGDAFDYSIEVAYAQFCLLDAIGHGVASTMMAATALAAMRSARRDGQGLYDMGRAVDEVLDREFGHSAFVTAVLGRLDLETGHLRFVNAGHPAPLLLRRGRTVGELTGGHRLPLGLDDAQIDVAEYTMEPGDGLLLYSDGVIEARDGDGEMFGVERLSEAVERALSAPLPAAEVLRSASRAVIGFSHQGRLTDDATLMLVQRSHDARIWMWPKLPA